MLRLGYNDNPCPLCENDEETCIHLFFKCPVARAIWFAGRWALKSDNAPVNTWRYHQSSDTTSKTWDVWTTTKQRRKSQAVTIYGLHVIWNLRNQILHNGGQANITATTRNIENRFQEFAYAMESEKPFRVEGDDNGEWIQVWTKLHELCSPLLAEAAAILWALQIALGEKWDRIILERGCKKLCWLTSGYEFERKASALVHLHLNQK